ncbi:MAG: GNVR domain-containing protein [Bacteroidota bacterium]
MQQTPLTTPPYHSYEEEEMTLKDIILQVKIYTGEVIRNIVWVILLGAFLAGLGYLYTARQKVTYTAGLTFMVGQTKLANKENAELSALLAAFNNRGQNGSNKIVELMRSGRIIHEVLFEKVTTNGKMDFLANHLIDLYGFAPRWNIEPIRKGYENLNLKDFRFRNDNIEQFSEKEYRALNQVRETISGNKISGAEGNMRVTYDKFSNLFRLEIETESELISLKLSEAIYEELKAFYLEETIGRPTRNLIKIKAETDSLLQIVYRKETQLAQATARRQGLISSTAGLAIGRLNRELQNANRLYTASFEQQQKLEFVVNNQTPDFQIIDKTFIPIKDAPSKLNAVLIGGVIGTFLSIGLIIVRKIVQDALAA